MRILFVASLRSHIGQFHMPFIRALKADGHEVHAAYRDNSKQKPGLDLSGIDKVYEVPFERSPFSRKNIKAYRKLKEVIEDGRYDIVHCHTPVAAMCTRLACRKLRKNGVKVFYTAHGFHFYKGAPLKNWLLYYPVEWICAWMTDVLITINEEDYALAKKHMHAKRVEYVPGVGIDLEKFAPGRISPEERERIRSELGVGRDDKLLLSVGELNPNKNHEVVIRALARMSDRSVHYAIAGVGELREYLINLADELGVGERVHLLGYRNDTPELYAAADLYVHPSLREGLPVALMEAIASKIPVICSDIRGNRDLVSPEQTFEPRNVQGLSFLMTQLFMPDTIIDKGAMVEANYNGLLKFDLEEVTSREIELLKLSISAQDKI